jgi:hypothetical protein
MGDEFEFQYFMTKKSFDRWQEIKRRYREARLKWRDSALKHDRSPLKPKPKSASLVRRYF